MIEELRLRLLKLKREDYKKACDLGDCEMFEKHYK